jgi:transcriptional regulator with GAF, ATPase, and Fis domain
MTMDGVMDCTCMPNMTAMMEGRKEVMESMMDMDMESMMSATGRAIRYVKKVENGQLRVRPVPVVKDRIIGALLISALRSQIQTAITSAISSAISSALGRSLVPTNKVSKVALRQLFNLGDGGLFGQLTAPATDAAASSGTNIMEEMAMNMAQQQIEQMLSSGELETMAMEFMSSGQMEQMVQDFMADPETEQMMNDMMAEVMRPPTEEEAAMMMSMMEELMKPPTEEEMAEMEQAWEEMMSSMMSEEELAQMEQAWMDWESQMEEEWKANGGLMGMMGMTGEDMQMMMQMMEMKAHCQCTSSSVAFGQMAMPSMPTAAGRK